MTLRNGLCVNEITNLLQELSKNESNGGQLSCSNLDSDGDRIKRPPECWRTVIFSDESKFCIFGIKCRKLVRKKPCTELQKTDLVPTVKHGGGGVMVWGCVASNGVGKWKYIESIMNKYDYFDVPKKLMESATELSLGSTFRFQRDSDPKHTTEIVMLWLLYNVPNRLYTPSQTPDLNPIEHL
ncbi:transposable element Tcb1 transposase [Trichonephila clavipes]|nr:transposable element Tcb1 transposase [Trichonephila clavipes]